MGRSCRIYCSVYGCLNSSVKQPELTFFKLPALVDRRSEWLQLICREDLASKSESTAHRVCEHHFNQSDILPTSSRKILKKTAVPSINLPDLQGSSVQNESPTENKIFLGVLVDNCTQTEIPAEDSSRSSAQATTNVSCDTPNKRELESEFNSCQKKSKPNEPEKDPLEAPDSTFHKLCDKYLSQELAILVKAQTRLKLQGKRERYDLDYVLFCLKLHFTSPQAYRLLHRTLCLPNTRTLSKHSIPITTELTDEVMSILKIKVAQMTEAEKNCSVMIDAMPLKTNLFYNIKEDKIIGFHEVDRWQSPEPARCALVIMVRGIFVNWRQPIAYALLSECKNYDEINQWIDKVLENLIDIGLNIRTLVLKQESDLFNMAEARLVSVVNQYFVLNGKKIYYIFDTPHLINNVRDNLMQYDFHFGHSVAKYEHIVQFYDQDTKKSSRLTPKLTDSHMKPTNLERRKVAYATQLLSKSVATGISTYTDFNAIEESGRATASFITKMNDLFDSLNSSNLWHDYEYKRAFKGHESQTSFFRDMLSFFQGLKIIDPNNGHDCTSNVKFIQGFQVTITSLLLLFDDLQSEGHTFLFTRRLNHDALGNLFTQLRIKNVITSNPTSRQFVSAFERLFFSNIIKPLKRENCADDLEKLLVQTTQEDGVICTLPKVDRISNTNDSSVQIATSDYNQLDVPERDALFYICGFLLKRCGEVHSECESLKAYIKPYQTSNHGFSAESRYLRYRAYRQTNSQSLLTVPCDDFVEYVEKMEKTFQTYFNTNQMNCKITEFIYKQIKDIDFSLPCFCFPKTYLIKLFIRMRIFYTIKFNNRAFRTSSDRCTYLIVDHL